jgi:flagellin
LLDGSIGAKAVPGTDNAAIIGQPVGKETSAALTGGAYSPAAEALDSLIAGTSALYVDGAKINVTIDTDRVAQYKAAAASGDDVASLLQEDINKAVAEYNQSNETSISNVNVSFETSAFVITSGTAGATSTIKVDAGAENGLFDATGIIANDADPGTAEAVGQEGVYTAGGAGSVAAAQGLTDDAAKMTFTVDGKEISIDLSDNTAGTNNFQTAAAAAADGDMSVQANALAKDFNKAIDNYNATVPASEQVEHVSVTVKDGSFVVQSGSDKTTSSIKFDKSEAAQLLGISGQSSESQGGGIYFQIGANERQHMQVSIGDMRAEALGINEIDLSNREGASEAITTIETAITKVSTQRSELGAFQNRLEHTISNLGTSAENLQAAEARIRDLDMAEEIMAFTKNNILQQAATAMLAQANMAPQSVLQLLG